MCEGKLIRQIDFFQSRTSVAPAAAAAIVTGGSPTREEIIVAVKFRNFFFLFPLLFCSFIMAIIEAEKNRPSSMRCQ